MIEWLKEQENYQKNLFNEWKNKSIESIKKIEEDFPFLSLKINCNFQKDLWLSGYLNVNYDLSFKLKPEHKTSFSYFLKEIFPSSDFNNYSKHLDEILSNSKKMDFNDLTKLMNTISNSKKKNICFNEKISAFDKFSIDSDMNELDGIRTILGQYGILTNSWITILDKSRSYDLKFELTSNELINTNTITDNHEKFYNTSFYGFNNIEKLLIDKKTKNKF
jgi:hypothetical protein